MEYRLKINGKEVAVTADRAAEDVIRAVKDGKEITARWRRRSDRLMSIEINGESHEVYMDGNGGGKTLLVQGVPYFIEEAESRGDKKKSPGRDAGDGKITPPMPAQVVRIMVPPGAWVKKGEGLLVVSAMKLETTLAAPFDGTVVSVTVKEGDRVMPGQVLALVEKDRGAEG